MARHIKVEREPAWDSIGAGRITKGMRYKIEREDGSSFDILDDHGRLLSLSWHSSVTNHGQPWRVWEDSTEDFVERLTEFSRREAS